MTAPSYLALGLALLAPRAETERAEIERAVLDYAESYYEARPEYVERSVHPELVKLGLKRGPDGAGYEAKPMTFEELRGMARWLRDNDRTPEPGPKRVVILDAMDQTALVELTGSWGIDYMQLAKFDGRWQTRHVLWQTAPIDVPETQVASDREAVEAAVRGYLEGLYQAAPERVDEVLAADFAKYGFWRRDGSEPYRGMAMSRAELLDLASRWNTDGHVGADAPRDIEVLGLMDRTACAKLVADWGVDYLHVAKLDDGWKIVQVLWQSPPAAD